MQKISALTIGLPLLLAAPAAHASVLVTSTNYGFDTTGSNTITFDRSLPPGFTVAGGIIQAGTNALGASPALSAVTQDTSKYLAVNPGEIATISSTAGFRGLSFYWGSIDSYNTVALLGQGGTVLASFIGDQIHPPSNGDRWSELTNRQVSFNMTDSTPAIYGVRFTSTQPAFEVDNVRFTSPVPETATWAMMILGFIGMGAAMRYRRKATNVAFA